MFNKLNIGDVVVIKKRDNYKYFGFVPGECVYGLYRDYPGEVVQIGHIDNSVFINIKGDLLWFSQDDIEIVEEVRS